jgi:hypothetical protein
MVPACRFELLLPQNLTSGVRAASAKQGILVFIIGGLAFTKSAVKKASIFYQICIFLNSIRRKRPRFSR